MHVLQHYGVWLMLRLYVYHNDTNNGSSLFIMNTIIHGEKGNQTRFPKVSSLSEQPMI